MMKMIAILTILICSCGKHVIERPLQEEKINVTGQDRLESKLFLEAVINEDYREVEALLESGVDPDSRDDLGLTALMESVRAGRFLMVRLLIKNGADPQAQDNTGRNAFLFAEGNEQLRLLLEGAEIPEPVLSADLVKSVNEAIPDGNGSYQRTLSKLKLLLKEGADINAVDSQKNSSLIYASYKRLLEIARFLVSIPGIEVNYSGARRATALGWARRNADDAMIDLLLTVGGH
jgi:ankyrin repeat protein